MNLQTSRWFDILQNSCLRDLHEIRWPQYAGTICQDFPLLRPLTSNNCRQQTITAPNSASHPLLYLSAIRLTPFPQHGFCLFGLLYHYWCHHFFLLFTPTGDCCVDSTLLSLHFSHIPVSYKIYPSIFFRRESSRCKRMINVLVFKSI